MVMIDMKNGEWNKREVAEKTLSGINASRLNCSHTRSSKGHLVGHTVLKKKEGHENAHNIFVTTFPTHAISRHKS
jgi:hypothetical protein